MRWLLILLAFILPSGRSSTGSENWDFDQQLDDFFQAEVRNMEHNPAWQSWQNLNELKGIQQTLRSQLWEMLGLWPVPDKTPVQVQITGVEEMDDFVVEKIIFQSRPGLYVTGNLYKPKRVTAPLPAILYVCGHATVNKDGYDYGSKAHYQHHPAWYARHGYICLVIDTLQLGEIEGIHHGLYRYDRWWWISRGYTPAGVEAWNGIRAIDYLLSRPDVDSDRLGVTGRSGGGATSWWLGGLDERIKVVVPVSGLTDLRNHVVNGCAAEHCDCMYFNNIYHWDYPMLGLLIAPRPLLIGNADRDVMFPVNGVYRSYCQIRTAYDRLGVGEDLSLNVVGGGHHDIPDIQVPALRWFNHYLQGTDSLMDWRMTPMCTPEELRVLQEKPADEINTVIDESFVEKANPILEQIRNRGFSACQQQWMEQLQNKSFRNWPEDWSTQAIPDNLLEIMGYTIELKTLNTDPETRLPLWEVTKPGYEDSLCIVYVLDDLIWDRWKDLLYPSLIHSDIYFEDTKVPQELILSGHVILLPMRGAGPARYTGDDEVQKHIRRRYYLLGTSLEAMQTWDLLQGLTILKQMELSSNVFASKAAATQLSYASLFTNQFNLKLVEPSANHISGPDYPNVLKFMDAPAAMMMAAMTNNIELINTNTELWKPFSNVVQKEGGSLSLIKYP